MPDNQLIGKTDFVEPIKSNTQLCINKALQWDENL